MATLHLVFIAPTAGTAFTDCLTVVAPGDIVLLLQDGVYAATAHATGSTEPLNDAVARGVLFYALLADVDARGLAGRLLPGLGLVDDNGFVELTERQPRTISWF